ncbi:snRNA-activating protein complex subunit 4 [Coregonus clupeaformis]|uniref:snRNA-activating protein complex subunit 4 n=1 Tax=Coregonus clupeaformis TaxID=59861 RepID=UPI001E1C5630|nr:snRNA-activating protein complex subunit 4 [Coregonus clupeaformis]
MSSDDHLAQREKLERQILALERTLGPESNSIELSSDSCSSDDGSDDNASQPEDLGPPGNLEAERERIQREIEELERTLGPGASNAEILSDEDCQGSETESSKEDSAEELDLPQNADTCLQMNLVYQEVLKEKLEELERLLSDNQQQQKEIMTQLSGTGTPQATTSGQPTLKLFLGSFLKPYFRDKVTCLGPPANPEAREKMSKRIRPTDNVKMKRWEGWQKTLLINAVIKDSRKRMIQPKLSKVEYLTQKMVKAENVEKQILRKQITEIEKDIEAISALKEDELLAGRYDDHDWQKISNIDFEGIREAEDIKSFWQNYLHPSINKASWKEDEIEMLKKVAVKYGHHNWDQIADKLGTNRTAFMCLQTYQRYICTDFRRRKWGGVEDEILRELVEKMRIGNYIPYTQISYFMEGRDSCQLMYRWTQVLDPTLKKGYWSKEEDEMLLRAVAKYGVGNWWKIRQDVPGRNDGQCRDRYVDVLIGNVKKGPFDEKEKAQLRRLVEKYGRKWSKIAAEIPNRIDCQVLQQWRRMTGYKPRPQRDKRKRALQRRRKTAAVRSIKSRLMRLDDDVHSSSDEEENVEMEFMDSDDEKKQQKFFDLSDQESDIIEDYTQPDIEQWIPMPEKEFEGLGKVRSMMVERPSKNTMQEQAATDSQAAARKFTMVRSTILDRFGKPAATVIGQNPPILAKKDYNSDLAMLKVCYGEVRNIIAWKKTNATKHPMYLSLQKNSGSMSGDQGTPHNSSRQKDSSAKSETCTTLNYSLQLAVTPWVGNVLIPPPLFSNKRREADMVRERAESIGLTNTPVFLFFLQVLRVDAEGCKQIIKMRNKQAVLMGHKSWEANQASLKKPKLRHGPRTVASMLNQKGKEQQNSQQQNSQLVMMIPQTFVIAQPVVQSIPHPAVPSTPTSRQQLMPSTLTQLGPSTPILPIPFTPGQPVPSTPSRPIPSTPGQPVPSTPSRPIPSTPGQPVPSTPSRPIPSTPGQPVPSTPILTIPSTPGQPVPSIPSRPIPSTPGQPVPSTPILPIPSTPGQPVPSTPSRPIPSTPGQPVPSTPSRPILPAPIQSSTTIDRVNEEANENHSGKKRIRKPTEKAQALKEAKNAAIAKKSVEESPKRKKARTRSPPKESIVVQPSNVVLSPPQTAWVLTPIGLVPISGIGIQMTPRNLPANAFAPACPSIIINQQVPLTLNAAAAQASPNMTYVCPCPSTPEDPSALMVSPASSIGQGTASPSVLTSLSTSTTFSNTAPRLTNPVNSVRITNPVMQTVATAGPQLNAVSPVLSVRMNTVISAPIRPQTGPPQALVLNVPPSSLPASFPQRGALRIVQLNPPKRVPPPRNPELIQFDPNLMFMEDPAQVREWLSGKRGVALPDLDVTLPYLPPFVSSLNTLSGLLKCKTTLAISAMLVLPPEEKENQEEQQQVAAVRRFVAERFSHNPGYLLLKARFLSCFTMPALLATINPVKLSKSPTPDHSDVEEEPFRNRPGEQTDTGYEQPTTLQAPLLSTDGTGPPATFFSGITTRNKSRYLNTDTE